MHTPKSPSALPRRASARGRNHAFTLIELLTVIAIIGVLAAILLPTISHVRASAKSSRCAANLRQTGTAIQNYISDNKGSLPPVGHTTISPYFTADPRSFQHALKPYLSTGNTTSWNTASLAGKSYSPTLDCPGYKGEPGGACFSIRQTLINPDGTTVTNADGTTMYPWAGIYQVGSQFLVTRKAMKQAVIPTNHIAIIDRDLSTTERNHSGHQNALYFDWHVGRVATN
jgi:prepilin-type N-terminal cleavage/methylation domain-containing protein